MFIRWGNSCSNKFYVTNGVKQGCILSAALFNVYVNDSSISLIQFDIGGSLRDNLINHNVMLTNLYLIALSSSGIKHLWDLCDLYTTKIDYLTMKQNHFLYILNQTELK